MDIKLKSIKKSYATNIVAFLILITMSIGIFSLYPKIKELSKESSLPYDNYELLINIYKSNYVLYKDILEQENGKYLTGDTIYLESYEENSIISDSIKSSFNQSLDSMRNNLTNNLKNLDYLAYSNDMSVKITNTDSEFASLAGYNENENLNNKYAFYMVIKYDENGRLSISNIHGIDDYKIIDTFTMRTVLDSTMIEENNFKVKPIKNATFIYGIPKDLKYLDEISSIVTKSLNNYNIDTHILIKILVVVLFSMLILGLIVPYSKGKEIFGIKFFLKIPLEINCVIFTLGAVLSGVGSFYAVCLTLEGSFYAVCLTLEGSFGDGYIGFGIKPELDIWLINIFIWIIIIYLIFAGDMLLKHIFKTGIVKYFKENLLINKIFKVLKKLVNKINTRVKIAICYISNIDLTDKSNKFIIKILALNLIIISIICILWIFGILLGIVYSIVLFIFLRKYSTNIKNKFEILLNATNKIADGNLDVEIIEDLGLFNPFKEQVVKIQSGFKKAVNEEVKSQRMKTELISNVSHDLKTPLTSIITYVDLLKGKNITEEERKLYIDTLDKKSQRLKFLIEDLFEVSRATSGNINLNLVKVDIVELMRQTEIELEDKIKNSNLKIRNNFPENKIVLDLDSQKTFRIFENLLNNAVKYAMGGSRVYVGIIDNEDTIEITIKNMSSEEINFDAFDIVGRFERGDKSRNTEGSGLGLAIAKSFVEVQGGTFNIEVDGDLFKVIIIFKK